MSPLPARWWKRLRLAIGLGILAVIVDRLGTGPFLAGVRALGVVPIAIALAVTAGTTVLCAWRWRRLVQALGGELTLCAAIGAYYRSQFLDATLPGGVLGDVHRGLRRGQAIGNLPRALQAVLLERVLGQVVQSMLALVALLALPLPVQRALWPWIAVGMLAVALAWQLAHRRHGSEHRWDIVAAWRRIGWHAWAAGAAASVLAIGGYVLLFWVAAAATGTLHAPHDLLPLALVVLAAAAIPLNIAGFGPREGAAGWLFAATGLGAASGVAIATAYGLLSLVACLPGGVLLLVDVWRARHP
ncbi:MAG: flippase-like domain-containing protein [Rhodanobacter sp.]|nr:MAG: flippase-like domain-containing protein [Rhodanobacter sp.]TAM10040.1 MAG: flippase-like domain-containing protein [Rhodanobacter sp.]TAM34736.1 MAG: flippase-like domain-containing protein [Rhodanobacter sp.]